ncbi:MAG: hypothetical protein ABIJ97_11365 [Bacteroidota bacterium]
MRTKYLISLFISACIILIITTASKSQTCDRIKICEENYGEGFEYTSQSRFGLMPLSEKKRVKTALYSGKRYRIFVCGSEDIGEINYKIIEPVRKTVKQIKTINIDTLIDYKTNQFGEVEYPEENNYQPVEIGRSVQKDTIWETSRVIEEKVLFDSKKNNTGNNYFEKVIKEQGFSIIIEATTATSDDDIEDCVNFYVGSKSTSEKQFGGYGKQKINP